MVSIIKVGVVTCQETTMVRDLSELMIKLWIIIKMTYLHP